MTTSPYEETLTRLIEERREAVSRLPPDSGKFKKLQGEIAELEGKLVHYRKAVNRFRHRPSTSTAHH
jgi:hypothetical protein